MNISVLGCGRWGGFLAWYAARLGHDVLLWGRAGSEKFAQLDKTRANEYLELPENVLLCSDLAAALKSDVVIISIASKGLRGLLQRAAGLCGAGKKVVLCMKGLEQQSGKRLTQVARECLPEARVAVWVGPGHVQDFVAGVPNCMVIDSEDEELKSELVELLQSDLIRFYLGTDLIGNEIGAAAKNVIGIAAGVLDGIGKTALKGALMSRGTREVGRLIKALGGSEMTAYGLAHLGDYEATVFSKHSHNRRYGEALAAGEGYGELAEGAYAVYALCELGERCEVDLPICRAVRDVIDGAQSAQTAVAQLFLRSVKKEF